MRALTLSLPLAGGWVHPVFAAVREPFIGKALDQWIAVPRSAARDSWLYSRLDAAVWYPLQFAGLALSA